MQSDYALVFSNLADIYQVVNVRWTDVARVDKYYRKPQNYTRSQVGDYGIWDQERMARPEGLEPPTLSSED